MQWLRTHPLTWSRRSLALAVTALGFCLVVLLLALVGFGRTVGLLPRVGSVAGDAARIAAEPPALVAAPAPAAPGERGEAVSPLPDGDAVSGGPEPRAATSPDPAPVAAPERSAQQQPASGGGGWGGVSGQGGGGSGGEGDGGGGRGGVGGEVGINGVASQALAATPGEPCGASTCGPGQRCCNASCGTCTEPGQTCSPARCDVPRATSAACGPSTCNAGQVCCNASCGICTAPGASCDAASCSGAPQIPSSVRCGSTQCNSGQVCCNPSCGICAAPGESCSTTPCD